MPHVFKDFTITKVIGEGSFGRTYLAHHSLLGTKVCLKLLLAEEEGDLFREEATLLAKVRHHLLPSLMGYWEEDDSKVIALSFLTGSPLDQVSPIHDEHICWILDRILEALSYLHYASDDPDYDRRIIHGDIKPANILLNPREHEAYLVDFGLASQGRLQAKGGTALFLAPEILRGEMPLPSSDLFALGRTAIHMAGGHVHTSQPPADMHPLLVQWIDCLVAHDPSRRFQTADEARIQLFNLREAAFGRTSTPEEFKLRKGSKP